MDNRGVAREDLHFELSSLEKGYDDFVHHTGTIQQMSRATEEHIYWEKNTFEQMREGSPDDKKLQLLLDEHAEHLNALTHSNYDLMQTLSQEQSKMAQEFEEAKQDLKTQILDLEDARGY